MLQVEVFSELQLTAEKLAMAQSTLSNKLRLLKLTPAQRNRITAGKLTERHTRAIIRLPEDKRDEVINRCVAEQLSVSDAEELVNTILAPKEQQKHPNTKGCIGDIRIFTNSITKMIGTMRKSGVDATSKKSETDEFIEYTITIPKRPKRENAQITLFDMTV